MRNKMFSKIFGKTNSFAETLQPIMWLKRLMGVSVIEYPIGHPWLKLSILNSLIRWSLYSFALYFSESSIYRKSFFKIEWSYKLYYVIRFIYIILAIATTALNFSTYRAKSLFTKKMAMTDAILKEFGIDPEYSEERRRNLCICLIWCVLSVVTYISSFFTAIYIYNSSMYSFIKTYVYITPVTICFLNHLKIGEQISIIARRFERLNALTHRIVESTRGEAIIKNVNKYHRILQRNKPKNASEDSTAKYKDNIIVMMKTVRQIHLYLCMAAREMMETYGTEILLHASSIFLLITVFSYNTYLIYNELTVSQSAKICQYLFMWSLILICLSTMVFMMNSATSVMEEAKTASHVAYEIQSLDQEVLNEIHQLSLQVMQHPLHLTASGFFVLDFVYIRGFIGSAATYFMILLQNRSNN